MQASRYGHNAVNMAFEIGACDMFLQSHAANQAVKGFQVGNLSVATHVHKDWSPNNGYVPFFPPIKFLPAYIHFYQPQRTRNPQTLPNHILLSVPPEDKTNKPLCQPLFVKVNLPCLKYPLSSLGRLRGSMQRMDRRLIPIRHLRVCGRRRRRV